MAEQGKIARYTVQDRPYDPSIIVIAGFYLDWELGTAWEEERWA